MKRIWLIDLRKNHGLTHQQVANKVDVTRQYYGMIESGERNPSVAIAKRIAHVFKVDWKYFFENDCYKTFRKSEVI